MATDVRKTIPRAAVIESLNRALSMPDAAPGVPGLSVAERSTLASFVGGILLDLDTYRGFGYQTSELIADGDTETPSLPNCPRLRADMDDSRRIYY